MKTKLVVLIILFTIYFKSSAQYSKGFYDFKQHPSVFYGLHDPSVFYVEYVNSDRNQLKAGLEVFTRTRNYRLFYGVGYGLVNSNKQIKGLLDYHVSYNSNNGFLVKISGSDRNVAPIIGVSLLNALDLGVGYSFPIKKDEIPEIQGFTVGLTVRFSKNNDVYEDFNIGF